MTKSPPYHSSFVYYYTIDPMHNATEAMIKARPELGREYATVAAARLLKKPHIKKMMEDLQVSIQGNASDVVKLSSAILQELERIGFSDIKLLFPEGTEERKMLDRLGNDSKVVQKMKIKTTTTGKKRKKVVKEVEVWFHDKLKALELRGKNLQLYTDVVAQTDPVAPSIYSLPDNGCK